MRRSIVHHRLRLRIAELACEVQPWLLPSYDTICGLDDGFPSAVKELSIASLKCRHDHEDAPPGIHYLVAVLYRKHCASFQRRQALRVDDALTVCQLLPICTTGGAT